MEPEGSSPYSQEPTICPYSEPDQSSLCILQHLAFLIQSHDHSVQVVKILMDIYQRKSGTNELFLIHLAM